MLKNIIFFLKNCEKEVDFEIYLNESFLDIQSFFYKLSYDDLVKHKSDIEIIYDSIIDCDILKSKQDSMMVQAFMLFIAEEIEKLMLSGKILHITNYIPESSIFYRLKATAKFIRVNDITTEYHRDFSEIMDFLKKAHEVEEMSFKSAHTAINYYLTGLKSFFRIGRKDLASSFKDLFLADENLKKYNFLQYPLLVEILSFLDVDNFDNKNISIKNDMRKKEIEHIKTTTYVNIEMEQGTYSDKTRQLKTINFNSLLSLSHDYIKKLGDPQKLYNDLQRGEVVIGDRDLLYKYLASYGKMHKSKLFEAYDTFFDKINGNNINIIDWGCGQGMGSMLIFDYIKRKNLNIKVENIVLIEPSVLAMQRAMLHIDLFTKKVKPIVKTVQKDLDSVEEKDITFHKKDSNITLHIFSNILDLETFNLNSTFLSMISNILSDTNYFICVSPNINAKRNSRLDLFFNHFNDGFDTELISSRDSKIGSYSRYEKIFKVTSKG